MESATMSLSMSPSMTKKHSGKRIFSYDEALTTLPLVRDLTAAAVASRSRRLRDTIGLHEIGIRTPYSRLTLRPTILTVTVAR